ncbi:hypothetical protein K6H10_005426, partial [Candida tropicalis]
MLTTTGTTGTGATDVIGDSDDNSFENMSNDNQEPHPTDFIYPSDNSIVDENNNSGTVENFSLSNSELTSTSNGLIQTDDNSEVTNSDDMNGQSMTSNSVDPEVTNDKSSTTKIYSESDIESLINEISTKINESKKSSSLSTTDKSKTSSSLSTTDKSKTSNNEANETENSSNVSSFDNQEGVIPSQQSSSSDIDESSNTSTLFVSVIDGSAVVVVGSNTLLLSVIDDSKSSILPEQEFIDPSTMIISESLVARDSSSYEDEDIYTTEDFEFETFDHSQNFMSGSYTQVEGFIESKTSEFIDNEAGITDAAENSN